LVVGNPYYSAWSSSDNLTDTWPTYWSGKFKALQAMVRVDARPFRLMGQAASGSEGVPPMQQVGFANVTATRTRYRFAGAGVGVTLDFVTPIRADNLSTVREVAPNTKRLVPTQHNRPFPFFMNP